MMIIDMGGGTVDMTIHDIDSLAGGDAMSMSEATHRECLAEVRLEAVAKPYMHTAQLLHMTKCSEQYLRIA
jgi:hypothetical protein